MKLKIEKCSTISRTGGGVVIIAEASNSIEECRADYVTEVIQDAFRQDAVDAREAAKDAQFKYESACRRKELMVADVAARLASMGFPVDAGTTIFDALRLLAGYVTATKTERPVASEAAAALLESEAIAKLLTGHGHGLRRNIDKVEYLLKAIAGREENASDWQILAETYKTAAKVVEQKWKEEDARLWAIFDSAGIAPGALPDRAHKAADIVLQLSAVKEVLFETNAPVLDNNHRQLSPADRVKWLAEKAKARNIVFTGKPVAQSDYFPPGKIRLQETKERVAFLRPREFRPRREFIESTLRKVTGAALDTNEWSTLDTAIIDYVNGAPYNPPAGCEHTIEAIAII